MNYFKEAENVLYHRRQLEKARENLQSRMARLKWSGAPTAISGLDPSKEYTSGGAVNDTMSVCIELVQVKNDLAATEAEIKEIDSVLHQLSPEDCDLLSLWYIDGKKKDDICEEMHYAKRDTAYAHRNKAVGEFAVLYYGAPGLSAL